MSEIKYCKRCRSLFKSYSESLCPACLVKYDEIMKKIRSYAEDNPLSDVFEMAKAIEEKETDILYLIREGRLSIKSEESSIVCAKCGIIIQEGKYCKKCSDYILNQLNQAKHSIKKDSDINKNNNNYNKEQKKGKMYTAYRHIDE